MNTNISQTLFTLLRAGLFAEHNEKCSMNGLDAAGWDKLYMLAEEQGVTGLIAAGIDRLNAKVPLEINLQFVGSALQTEQRNKEMNAFIADIVAKMREKGIYTLLVKGQGIAQCYEKPLWRPSGDVDFLLDIENYRKAIDFLRPLSSDSKREENYSSHLGLSIDPWYVEVHGSLRTGLSAKVDRVVDEVHEDTFKNHKVRVWNNGGVDVLLPAPDEDVFFVFTHFIKHFYKEGMSLRQTCDWCRLLYTYKDSLNYGLLKSRIRKAGLVSEWKAFAVLAIEYLGMPAEVMPLFDVRCKRDDLRAKKLIELILGENSGSKAKDTLSIAKIFPINTIRFAPAIFLNVNSLKIKERLLGN